MSTPLSPLTSSRQNSRTFSPASRASVSGKGGLDEIAMSNGAAENAFSSPFKLVEEVNTTAHAAEYGSDREFHTPDLGDEQTDFVLPPSSPFQDAARDDTADIQMLQKRYPSLGHSDRSATPRKRSYEHGPDSYEVDEEVDERYKKGSIRRDVPDINIHEEEDVGLGIEPAVERHEVANSMVEDKRNEGMSTVLHENDNEPINEDEDPSLHEANDAMNDDSHDPMDDTCFSTFSAVTNTDMTAFAMLRNSPIKGARPLPSSPSKAENFENRGFEPSTPATAKRSPRKGGLLEMSSPNASPTPRRRDAGNPSGTPNLLDFTDQLNFFQRKRYSIQNERGSPLRRSPLRAARESMRSPTKMSLLDFDIPSAPTPRSIPTVTPRELESLKSGFMSEISSLKATLSGKEAEVASLKQAVADAERRVGEALEEVRNESARKEALEFEQAEWERRGQEMEDVLRSVKAEIVDGEREKERLLKKVEDLEKAKERLESRMVELETQLDSARKSAPAEDGSTASTSNTKTAEQTAMEVQDAVEKVARELHTLYKSKHETKVAALKKSYEGRWEKRVREAENKLKAVNEENERLKSERDAALSEASRPDASIIAHEKDEHEAEKRVLEAQIKGLQQEMAALKKDSDRLRNELKAERAEKGELVAAVDEWLAMQQNQPPVMERQSPQPRDNRSPVPEPIEAAPEEFSRSTSRSSSSSIRPPSTGSGHGEKKIPKIGAPASRHVRGNSGGKSGIAVFTPGRSGIMGSIERMGRGV
ncbi:conserved hypothetical protein [Aspergillus terreus NIH2624]|uniref:Uncharacterized protein n=1 Tax=Aspergillus terreus (strain NIH 2624 / FGSC A1156) TaxID=341663 RepID=Q0D208_ASPTN|nr:uncharacterized protein ATEG_00026 [Aspergillus terreus NIH2624]EAU38672.1 conserved hypothetical protein [Aspergillus terreus NIH2624]